MATVFPAVSVTRIPEIRWRAAMLILRYAPLPEGFARVIGPAEAVTSDPGEDEVCPSDSHCRV